MYHHRPDAHHRSGRRALNQFLTDSIIPSRDKAQGLLVPAEWTHVDELARTMLQADQQMCRDAGYEPCEAIFRMLLPAMNKFTFLAGGHVAAMFGTVARPLLHHLAENGKRTPEGQLWCLVGEFVSLAPWAWATKFKFAVNELLGHYDSLHAFISPRNEQMLRLARFVGGDLDGPMPFGPSQALFWKWTARI